MKPKVSVIIPVYNVEQYLQRCLDSIIHQTLKEIEIICVEDCSTDNSSLILEQNVHIDSRIKVIKNKVNSGLSFSRNRGIEAAEGEYIQFLDSDDFLYEDALEIYYDWASKYELDVLKTGYEVRNENGSVVVSNYADEITQVVKSGMDLLFDMLRTKRVQWGGCSNFLKTDYVKTNNFSFHVGILHEDIAFTYSVLMSANKSMCIEEAKYVYIKREQSITMARKDVRRFHGCVEGMNDVFSDFCRKNVGRKEILITFAYLLRIRNYANRLYVQLDDDTDILKWNEDLLNVFKISLFRRNPRLVDFEKVEDILINSEENESLYIFGAGQAAKYLLEWLNAREIGISGVIVTSIEQSKKAVYGHRAIELEGMQGKNIDRKAKVLVAITEERMVDAIERLERAGFKNIYHVC